MKTVVGVFETEAQGREAVKALADEGFRQEDISLATRGGSMQELHLEAPEDRSRAVGEAAAESVGVGAVVGGMTGLVIGLSSIAVPGLGAVAAAGPLAGLISGSVTGAVTGGIAGALIQLGLPEQEAEIYAEAVRRGKTIVAVRVPDEAAVNAQAVLDRYDPVEMERKDGQVQLKG